MLAADNTGGGDGLHKAHEAHHESLCMIAWWYDILCLTDLQIQRCEDLTLKFFEVPEPTAVRMEIIKW